MTEIRLSDLIFTGFNRRVAALHRQTGQIIWSWKGPSGNSYTTLLLDGDRLIVSVNGFMYALNPLTGEELWSNEMIGFGYGVTSLVSVRGSSNQPLAAAAAEEAASRADHQRRQNSLS
jgi:outer membrane protein assembly factor BamB